MNLELLLTLIALRFIDFLIIEGFLKKTISSWGTRGIIRYLPKLFDRLDPIMPSLLKNLSEQELRDKICHEILGLESNLNQKQLEKILELYLTKYNLLINAKKLDN